MRIKTALYWCIGYLILAYVFYHIAKVGLSLV